MTSEQVQLEVLLLTGTSLASANFCRREDSPDNDRMTANEKLAEACWNGLLQDILPEIFQLPCNGRKLYIWQIKEASSFLELAMGEIPPAVENATAITPYLFLRTQHYN